MNTQGGCSDRTDWIGIEAKILSDDDEQQADLTKALREAYFRGLRDATSACRQVMDRRDAEHCCQLTVRACVDEIERYAA